MKNNIFKIAAILIMVMAVSFFSANAQDTNKELKLKTNVSGSVVKNKIETITNSLKGVSESDFNSQEKVLTVKYNPDEINSDMLIHVLQLVGYDTEVVEVKNSHKDNLGSTQNNNSKKASS